MRKRIWGSGYCGDNVMTHNKKKVAYKVRNIRLGDLTWERLKQARWKSRMSWNLFVVELLKKK